VFDGDALSFCRVACTDTFQHFSVVKYGLFSVAGPAQELGPEATDCVLDVFECRLQGQVATDSPD
jgi:hypothetical protein